MVLDLNPFRIPLKEIYRATKNFSLEHLIVEDGTRKFYKGQLSERWGNRTAAIKRHDRNSYQEAQEFFNQLTLMSDFKHVNIVPFIGFCNEGDEMIIVTEYSMNGSLYNLLENGRRMSWARRLRICNGAARGLKYLHSAVGERSRVIHRNFNSRKILLGEYLEVKICGFRFSTYENKDHPRFYEFPTSSTSHTDPIYRESGISRTASDIYSFGVILFEMLSGIPAYRVKSTGDVEQLTLINWVRRYHDVGLDELVDIHIRDQIDSRSLQMVTEIAYRCIGFNIKDRPTIDIVIKIIQDAMDISKDGYASFITIGIHQHQNPNISRIPLREIKRATGNFSREYWIGDDRFGSVYRGRISIVGQSRMATIKRLIVKGHQGMNDFLNELEMLSIFHHDNIIQFIGYADEDNEKIIVTEYASNGSLDIHFQDPKKRSNLTWTLRLKICLGIARGLEYLHSGLGERGRVIHRDANSVNIMLDDNMEAKICNFGLSKLIPRNQSQVYELPVGTNNYIDPVYYESGFLKTEADIYTFGVVMFEILSGMVAYKTRRLGYAKPQYLMHMVQRYYGDGLQILVDPYIEEQIDSKSLETFREIAYECISFNYKDRPSMKSIVKRIETLYNENASSNTILHQKQNLEDFLIPLEKIKTATNEFHKKKLVGGGGFGLVYKGKLSEGRKKRIAAIKRLNRNGYQGNTEFLNELKFIFRFRHENIIPFIGYCDQNDEMIIVTEYATNSSLDRHLQSTERRSHLTWEKRLQICLGAARGISYLHAGQVEDNRVIHKVIHRDIKSGNILLDGNMKAKVCDFGLSRSYPKNQTDTGLRTKAAGTKYYIDPIYQESGELRTGSDVYSFGVVMFEMLSGVMAYQEKPFGDDKPQFLIDLVRCSYAPSVDKLMDPLIRDRTDRQSFLMFQEIAFRCISMIYEERPTMEAIIDRIEKALDYQENFIQLRRQRIFIGNRLLIGSGSKSGTDQEDKK
uniref:tyrosine-protein kinase JAK2-like n=1 Tax=Erigeron canadensis TaxID=72917 RepID=UPI001CB91B4F|nr:tyrosine-protein kinase JAK2-like [Erigeron canadensis]